MFMGDAVTTHSSASEPSSCLAECGPFLPDVARVALDEASMASGAFGFLRDGSSAAMDAAEAFPASNESVPHPIAKPNIREDVGICRDEDESVMRLYKNINANQLHMPLVANDSQYMVY
ncbi:hypothetical protein WSS15_12460 [Acetobacter pasteurianus]|nr:hypothetical protein WSS15_12460 [Acetobacter pasteurianus]